MLIVVVVDDRVDAGDLASVPGIGLGQMRETFGELGVSGAVDDRARDEIIAAVAWRKPAGTKIGSRASVIDWAGSQRSSFQAVWCRSRPLSD